MELKFRGFSTFLPFYKWVWNHLQQAWYWLRCHTLTRYHILDLRNEEYSWGFEDTDYLMLYACFKLLVDFVEKQDPFQYHHYKKSPVDADGAEIWALYRWWIQRTGGIESWDQDQKMLLRLMAIRGKLWT